MKIIIKSNCLTMCRSTYLNILRDDMAPRLLTRAATASGPLRSLLLRLQNNVNDVPFDIFLDITLTHIWNILSHKIQIWNELQDTRNFI